MKSPLTVYVLWHPRCAAGPRLGHALYSWLRLGYADGLSNGAGIPVYYRSEPFGSDPPPEVDNLFRAGHVAILDPFRSRKSQDSRRPADISWKGAVRNAIVPLVDEHMVADDDWRSWLLEVVTQAHTEPTRLDDEEEKAGGRRLGRRNLVVPVQLHRSFNRLRGLAETNAIPLERWDDPTGDAPEERTQREDRWCFRLRRYVSQALLRWLLAEDDDATRDLRRSVFLSHAKADREDGVGIAEAIRGEALALGQIDTFFDATDLTWAAPWERAMLGAAERRTAAFVAILSDRYASRYWCRKEAGVARTPRPLKADGGDLERRVWLVQPSVAVTRFSGRWSRLIPELSGVPVVNWRDRTSAAEVLDRAVLEALLAEVHLLYAKLHHKDPDTKGTFHYLTWPPERFTFTEWKRLAGPAPGDTVVVPAHALTPGEQDSLRTLLGDTCRLTTFEDLYLGIRQGEVTSHGDGMPRLALSGGSPPAIDLARHGCGREHLTEAVFRLSTTALDQGLGISYGGALGPDDGPPLLLTVLDAAEAAIASGRAPRDTEVVRSYQAWFPDGGVSAREEADAVGVCRVERVQPLRRPSGAPPLEPWEERWLKALSLWEMRKRLAEDSSALLALGGRVTGFQGLASGVVEEVAAMVASDKPVYLFVGFGGASARIVRWLLEEGDRPVDLVVFARQLEEPGNSALRSAYDAGRRILGEERINRLFEAHYGYLGLELAKLKREVHGATYGGLDGQAYRALVATDSVRVLRRALAHEIAPYLHKRPMAPPTPR